MSLNERLKKGLKRMNERSLTNLYGDLSKQAKLENMLPEPMSISKKKSRQNTTKYIDIPIGFDIETSSYYFDDNAYQVYPKTIKERDKYHKGACMYIWMIMIDKQFFYGRTWDSFLVLIELLHTHYETSLENRLVIYVHNLAFEFQFMRKYFEFETVFALDNRKVCYCLLKNGIEFRCSYLLTNLGLASVGEKIGIKKMVGDLDYTVTRGRYTRLTQQEMGYCFHDVLIVAEYIRKQIIKEKGIANIPFTKTGYVRRDVRKQCMKKYKEYTNLMSKLTLTSNEYKMLKRAFMGGFTHANAHYVGETLKNVTSRDFTSSYPAVMLSEMYPMGKGRKVRVTSLDDIVALSKDYCVVFDVKFKEVEEKKTQDNPLSKSKCWNIVGGEFNNGRVRYAKELSTTITNVDYDYIRQFYTWGSYQIGECYIYRKAPLPEPILDCVYKYYKGKTELKDVVGREEEYQGLKEFVNSIYGMIVTDIVRDVISYTDEWEKPKPGDANEQIKIYNESKNRFLFYPWGVFVTAYARRNLFTGIAELGEDYIYADTDSVKFFNNRKHDEYFKRYNRIVTRKIELNFMYYNKKYIIPKTIEGKEKPLGVWDFDGNYSRFKTLGAKRYLAEYADGKKKGKWLFTVSGIRKEKGVKYLKKRNGFDSFNDGMIIPKEESGALVATYLDEPTECLLKDCDGNEWVEKSLSGVHMDATTKSLTMSSDFLRYVESLQ